MGYQMVDKKCPTCKAVVELAYKDEVTKCSKCGTTMERIFGNGVAPEFRPQWFDGFEAEPIFIESREQFVKECESRGLTQKGGGHCYDYRLGKKRSPTERINPPPRKLSQYEIAKKREEAIGNAVQKVYG